MHPQAEDRGREEEIKEPGEDLHSSESLPLLYQGLLTGIVRVKARRQHISDGDSFKRRIRSVLQEVEQVAVGAGYDSRDIRNTHFAVVAFLDSVVLNSNEPVRAEWERKTLQEELFGQTDAGVVFFDKLEHFRSRRDSMQLADILEVYLLCILLGFEGRYSKGLRGELESIAERLRLRIENIRGSSSPLSIGSSAPTAPPPPPPSHQRTANRLGIVTIAAIIVTILLFLLLRFNLAWISDDLGKLL